MPQDFMATLNVAPHPDTSTDGDTKNNNVEYWDIEGFLNSLETHAEVTTMQAVGPTGYTEIDNYPIYHQTPGYTTDVNTELTFAASQQPQAGIFSVENLILTGALDPQQQTLHPIECFSTGIQRPEVEAEYESDYPLQNMPMAKGNQMETLVTTASGHKRGPLNGGCFFPNERPLPDLISGFRPQLYLGPPAGVKSRQSAINTQGKNVKYNIYSTIVDTHPKFRQQHGHTFAYDSRGRLAEHILFDRENFAIFVKYHPLGKNLWFRLEKFPANCKGFALFSQDHSTYNKCRARDCPSREKGRRGFHDGTIRVAIEEVLGRIPRGQRFENNPYFCAGYLHIDCLENLIDIGQLVRAGMLRPKPREFHPKEPNTSKTEPQVLCPPAKLVTCFEEFCKRILQLNWDGYLHNLADRLQTYVWLSVQKKGKWSTHDAPSDMKKEDAQELLRRRPVDPNWGGGRRPGLAMKTVKKAEAAGKRSDLVGPGTGRNSERAQKTAEKIIEEVESLIPDEFYEDGESWLRDCYIPLANPGLLFDQNEPELTPSGQTTLKATPSLSRYREVSSRLIRNSTNSSPSELGRGLRIPSRRSYSRITKLATKRTKERPFDVDFCGSDDSDQVLTLADGSAVFYANGVPLTLKKLKQSTTGAETRSSHSPIPVNSFDPSIFSPSTIQSEFPYNNNQTSYRNPSQKFDGTQSQYEQGHSTSQLYHSPFSLSPTTSHLFYPPMKSPIALDFSGATSNQASQDSGFDFGNLEAAIHPTPLESQSSDYITPDHSQSWPTISNTCIDPQLLVPAENDTIPAHVPPSRPTPTNIGSLISETIESSNIEMLL